MRSTRAQSCLATVLLVSASGSTATAQLLLDVETRGNANSPATSDNFGCAVSVSGTWAAVGAQQDSSGAGFVALYSQASNYWTWHSEIQATTHSTGDNFGHSVSLFSSDLAVGAYKRPGTYSGSGAAYVFHWNGTSWSQQVVLAAGSGGADEEANAWFGYSVSLYNDLLVVGCPNKDESGQSDAGAAYIYKYVSGSWQFVQKLTAPTATASDYFGWSVATNGTTILIGAPGDDNTNGTDAGAVYEYTFSGSAWSLNGAGGKLIPPSSFALGQFGFSVASAIVTGLGAANNSAYVVGSLKYDSGLGHIFPDTSVAGTAFITWRTPTTLAWNSFTVAPDISYGGDGFGISVGVEENGRVVVGANEGQFGGGTNGQAFVYHPSFGATPSWQRNSNPPNLNPTSPLGTGSGNHHDWFGRAVALYGAGSVVTVLVGSHFGDTSSVTDTGIAYFFRSHCYANCDNSTATPILNANDFQCFLTAYSNGTSYANCDGSTGSPTLNANDFQCYLNMYALGCS
jgi:hypothetical protein